jgi:hypothetical protein
VRPCAHLAGRSIIKEDHHGRDEDRSVSHQDAEDLQCLSTLQIIGPCFLLILSSIGGDEAPKEAKGAAWQDAFTYRMSDDAVTKSRVIRTADWLKSHLVNISRPGEEVQIRVIAWKQGFRELLCRKYLA